MLCMVSPSLAQTFRTIGVAQGLSNSVVKCFAQDADGFLWIGTFDGLCRYDGNHFTTYRHAPGNSASMGDNHVEALLSVNGQLLAGTSKGLYVLDVHTRRFAPVSLPTADRPFIRIIKAFADKLFVFDSNGRLWWSPREQLRFQRYRPQGHELFQDLSPVNNKRMLLLSSNRLSLVDGHSMRVLSSIRVEGLPTSGNIVYYSHVLRQAIIGSGIGHASRAYRLSSDHQFSPSTLTLPDHVKAITDIGQRTAFATDGNGLFFFSPHAANPTQVVPNDHFALHALFVDRDGNLWTGTYRNGVELMARGFDLFRVYNRQNSHLTQNVVTALFADRHALYAGTDGGGLCVIGRTNGNTKTLTTANSRIPGNNIVAMAPVQGGLLLGIYGHGLCRYDLANGSFSPVTLPRQSLDVLWKMHTKGDHHVVVTGQMTNIVDRRTSQVVATRPTSASKNPSALIQKLSQLACFRGLALQSAIADRQGNLWVSTDNGLFCRRKASRTFIRFGASDHLPAVQFCQDACATDGSSLFFGSTEGVVEVVPANLSWKASAAKVCFNGVSVLAADSLRQAYGEKPGEVTLRHNEDFFTIHLSVPEYVFPGRVRIRYRLEGLDKGWRTAEDTRDITYSGVPHGHYRFLACVADASGQWSSLVSELPVRVLPPWYLAWWAKTLWLLLAAAAAYGVVRAWSHRRQLAEELKRREAEKRIEQRANEDKLNFFMGVTHELRTPMFLITAPLEELLDSPHRPVQVPYSYLKSMYRNALRLNKLVNRIIDIRKKPDGSLRLTTGRCDLVKTCQRISRDFRALCLQKRITFRLNTTLDHLEAEADVEKLELMLSNLVTNAYKYTPEDGHVTMELTADATTATFRVSDDGIGMTAEQQAHVFEPYYRTDSSAQVEGSGVGLAFVAQLVKTYGGHIAVTSKPREGSTFTLTLLLHPDGDTANKPSASQLAGEAKPIDKPESLLADLQQDNAVSPKRNPMATRRVLVVDDEAGVQALLADHLAPYYEVTTASDGYAGIEKTKDLLPDVILCDMMMPGMDGLEFLERLKADKTLAHIPVIMLTAKTLDADRVRSLEAGAAAYLTKPVSLKVLRAHIGRALASANPALHDSLTPQPTETNANNSVTSTKKAVSKEDEKFILRCKDIIDQHMEDQTIDVETLAQALGMSHSALYKRIRAITGTSPADLILTYKLFKATTLFKEGDTNITHVAYRCGFNSIHAFRAAFKTRMGMTPSDYIKNM